jgi:hypothetical protein
VPLDAHTELSHPGVEQRLELVWRVLPIHDALAVVADVLTAFVRLCQNAAEVDPELGRYRYERSTDFGCCHRGDRKQRDIGTRWLSAVFDRATNARAPRREDAAPCSVSRKAALGARLCLLLGC